MIQGVSRGKQVVFSRHPARGIGIDRADAWKKNFRAGKDRCPVLSLLLAILLGLAVATVSWAQTFGTPELLDLNGAPPGHEFNPFVISDGAGTWLAVWWSTETLVGTVGEDHDLHFARSTDGGATWSYPAPLNNNAANDSGVDATPYLATDNAGTWLAVWRSTDSLGNTIGTDRDILFARSTDAGATWTPPEALNSNAATDFGDDFAPIVATDGAGNWVAVWWSYDSLGNTIGTDRDVLFSRSTDAGATWSAPTALNTNAATDSGEDYARDLVTDRSGNWLVTWDSDDSLGGRIGTDRDVLFARSSDAGVTWTTPAALNSNAHTDTTASDVLPEVATDASGNWLVTWISTDTLSGTVGTDKDVFVSRSVDAGATWTAAAPLNSSATTDTRNDPQAMPMTDGAGHWITVWYSFDSFGDTIGIDSDILSARSTDAGATWTAAAPLNTNAFTDSSSDVSVAIAADSVGNWVAVWSSANPLDGTIGIDSDILIARSVDAGATWTAPVPLNANAAEGASYPSEDVDPGVATDAGGSWVAVWTSDDPLGGTVGTDQDIVVSRSVDAGTTWTAPVPLNDNAMSDVGDDNDPEVATDEAGSWVAVWASDGDLGSTIGTDRDILTARSTDAGATWTAPAALNSNAASDSGADSVPVVAADAAGNWVAAWTSVDTLGSTIGSDADILVARSGDSGATWTNVAPLGTNAASDRGDDDHPELVTDGEGTWLAVWESSDWLARTVGRDLDTFVARSTDAGVTWTPPAPLNANAGTDAGDDTSPTLATDGLGTWVAVWASNDSLDGTIGNDWDILVTRSADAGQTWSAPEALSVDAAIDGDDEFAPHIRTDGAGNWDAVWYRVEIDPYYGDSHELLLSRSTDAGVTWSVPEYLTSEGLETSPQIVTDGVGNWLVVWDSHGWFGEDDGDILQIQGSGPDADDDGLADGAEVNLYGTEPFDADTDDDGLSDGDEVEVYFTDPLDLDSDGDGASDGDEVAAGFDPNNPKSTPLPLDGIPAFGPVGSLLLLGLIVVVARLALGRGATSRTC